MRYKTKVDWFVAGSLLVGIAAPAFIAVTQNLPWMSAASVLAVLLLFGISYPQWYETGPGELIIKSGLTTRLIPYSKIVGVRLSNDSRVAIDYGVGNLLITPLKAREFMDDVVSRAPHLSKSGQDFFASAN